MNKFQKYIFDRYKKHKLHIIKIVFIAVIFIFLLYTLSLPYINLIAAPFLFLPYFVSWILIMILFKPQKELVLKAGIVLFVIDLPFALLHLNIILEPLGQASYLFIGTYVFLSLKELKN